MTTRTFTGANNTYYTVAGNWSPSDAYPDNGDTAVIINASVNTGGRITVTNVTWNVTNSTITGHGDGSMNAGLTTLGTFTMNLSGSNTLALFAYIDGPATFIQAANGTTTITDIFEAQGTSLSLLGGTYSDSRALIALGSTITLNTNFQAISTGAGIEATSGGTIAITGGSVLGNFVVQENSTLAISNGISITGSSIVLVEQSTKNNIVFTGQDYGSYSYDGTTLTVGPYSFSDTGDAGATFYLYHVGADTVLSTTPAPACFLKGTSIQTATGPVKVEELAIGHDVLTIAGALRPVKWIGRRSYGHRFAKANPRLQPVVFEAGCLDKGVPSRDLFVSQDHAMFLDGILVPARLLVNGVTISIRSSTDDIEYFHIELETHDIIFAEGAAAETFLDDESRGVFHNAADFHRRYPGETPRVRFCAPRLDCGFDLEAIRMRLEVVARSA